MRNARPGQASMQGAAGRAFERPFDVKFGPDGAMYIADYGVANINPARAAQGQVPYEFPARTGAIWRVTQGAGTGPATPPAQAPPFTPQPPPSFAPAPAPLPGMPNTGGQFAAGRDITLPVLPLAAALLAAVLGLGLGSWRRRQR